MPMVLPNWPCHAQSIEQRVKEVTDACDRVFFMKSEVGGLETKKDPGNSCQKMVLSKI